MMTKSEKQGILVLHVFIFPGSKQTSQLISKPTGSCFINSSSSKGLTKLSLLPIASSSLSFYCFNSSSAFQILQPIFCNYYSVLRKYPISICLSSLGAKGFLMFELPLGSRIRIVRGQCFPYKQDFTFYKNTQIFWYYSGEFLALSSWLKLRSSKVLLKRASALVTSAFFEGIYNQSYQRHRVEYYERMISLSRSSLCKHRKRISTPRSGSLPANWTSLFDYPQCQQWKEQRRTYLKRGMSTSSMMVVPVWWHRGHSVSA